MNLTLKKSDIKKIEIDLTGVCNLSCPRCSRNYSHNSDLLVKNVRPINEITKQLDEYPNLRSFLIAGAVSEPTMYKDIVKLIEYLNGRTIKFTLLTNGNTHTEKWWERLGEIVPKNCKIIFTICGSTQELHEKYRVGANLEQMLKHARAVRRSGKRHDWVQHIRFEYNAEDTNSEAMQLIMNEFSNKRYMDAEGIRRLNEYINPVSEDIKPLPTQDRIIKQLFKNRPLPDDGKKYTIRCRSFEQKKAFINQFGQVSACHTSAEFERCYFKTDTFDYTEILSFKYPDCFVCEQRTRTFIEKMGLYNTKSTFEGLPKYHNFDD